MTAGRRRVTRIAAVSALLLVAVATPGLAATPPPGTTVTRAPASISAATERAVITATEMDVTGFRYTGITKMASGPGSVDALTFVMATSSLVGYSLAVPCHAVAGFNMQFDMAVSPGVAASSPASMTVYATELGYSTSDPTVPPPAVPPYRWTVAAPPPPQLLAADTGKLTTVKITLVRLDAPTMKLGVVKSTSSFC